jgi:hypothetical protein
MPNIQKIKNSGMIVGPQKASQPTQFFRKLLNVWQDSSGDFRPLGKQAPLVNFNPAGLLYVAFGERFDFTRNLYTIDLFTQDVNQLKSAFEGIFYGYVFRDISGSLYFRHHYVDQFLNPREYQANFNQVESNGGWLLEDATSEAGATLDGTLWKGLYANTQIRNKLFFRAGRNLDSLQKFGKNLRKFDGLQCMSAGLTGPILGCTSLNASGDRYITTMAVRLGFDGELVASQILKFRANQSGGNITFTTGSGATPVSPSSTGYLSGDRGTYDDNDYDLRYVVQTSGPTTEISPGVWQIASINYKCYPGDYLFFLDGITSRLLSVRVIATGAGFIQVKTDLVRYYVAERAEWVTGAYDGVITNSVLSVGTSIYNLVYSSNTSSGGNFVGVVPMLPIAAGTINYVINTAATFESFLGLTSVAIGDWYDTTSVKIPFPDTIYAWTNYQELLIGCDRDFLYFSDPTLGGCTEMTSGLANVAIPGSGLGPITGVMASEDFIVISRERRNYVLVGDLFTGNIRIKECAPDFIGAYSPRSMVAANGGVFLTTRKGVYFVSGSGNMIKISSPVTGLFQESLQDVDEDGPSLPAVKMDTNFLEFSLPAISPDPAKINFDGNRVIMKIDEIRNSIVIFFKKSTSLAQTDNASCLVFNLDNQSWQEWGKFDQLITDIVFLPNYSVNEGRFNGSLILARLSSGTREELNYQGGVFNDKAIICTNWESAGEPSLEKKFLQVKMYGNIPATIIKHFENWQKWGSNYLVANNPKTNVTYPANPEFYHKQRLDANSSLVVSVSIEFASSFKLRGLEIEINPIQEGMKK